MKISRIISPAVAALCIMALVVAGAGAAGTPGSAGQGSKNGPAAGTGGSNEYTITQTLSDQAQLNTLAFDSLAFITGDVCSDTFLPPGKVADYAGFQYLRDNDKTQMGHNTDFVTRASDNVLYILNDDQLAQFVALSGTEAPLTSQYGYMRFPLTTAFRDQYSGTFPSGSSGLDKAAVMAYSGKLYDVDASISIERAKTYASVINSLNQTQRAYLDTMKSGGMLSWPVVDASAVLKNSGQGNSVAMRTYASEMFAWYVGSVDADVYFCPERQATYFGSFYMKDRPAMGNAGYSISTTLTGDSGEEFLNLLTSTQREKITGLVDLQRADLNEIVATRKAIATDLRRPLSGGTIDENAVRVLSARYGELDGEISYYYATHFADVGKTLTNEQKQKMIALRNLAGYTCEGAYLYSQPISMPQNIPSDFLFGVGSYDSSAISSWLQSQQQTTIIQEPGTGKPGQGQGNVTKQGTGDGSYQGNAIQPGPANGPWGGNGTQAGQGPRQGQERRMPVEDIIAQLEEEGYDVIGAKPFLQGSDRETVKAWLDEFRKVHPGVVESIEGAVTKNQQDQERRPGGPHVGNKSQSPVQPADKGKASGIKDWFLSLWESWWGEPGQHNSPREIIPQSGGARPGPVPAGNDTQAFSLTSDAGPGGGTLPAEYSCDGAGSTPALSWSGVPEGTKEFALMMTTLPVDGATRWNWVLYGIPGSATGLAKDSSGVGITGTGSHGTVMQYDPPCPQGPGAKTYTVTLYALSASPALPGSPDQVTGPVLTSAISTITLGTASFNMSYARP